MRIASVARSLAVLALSVALAQAGCSGGGGNAAQTGGDNGPPPPPALVITTNFQLPHAVMGQSYSQMLQASGGTPPYTWATWGSVSFPCPQGISLSASGLLSGTPTGSWGNQGCFVQVTDSSSPPQTVKTVLTLFVIAQLTLGVTLPNPPSVRNFYSALLFATGGFGPYTWTIQSGSLPPGLTLTGTGPDVDISGVPTARGTYNFTVQVTDTGPPQQTATQAFSLTVFDYPAITTTFLPVGLINYPYTTSLQAIGGTPPYSWSVNPPSLAPGLTLDPKSGTLSGTPTAVADQYATFTVTDSQVPPLQGNAFLHLVINPVLHFTQSQPALPDGVQTQPYTYPMPFQGGLPPYIVTLPSGALPAGISIAGSGNSNVSFSGSPTTLATSNFTLSIQDSESPAVTIQQAFSIRVNPRLVLQNVLPPPAAVGLPYSFQFQVTGGLPPLKWFAPTTIAGLTLNLATGLMSGTPTESGPFSFAVSVQDSSNPYQTSTLGIDVFRVYDKLKVATSVLPPIALNSPVNMRLSGFGGTGNYFWLVTSGNLPNGLSLDSSTGVLAGQTAQTGVFPITLQLSDPGPPAQTATLTIPITVKASLGRNDSVATATPLSNGTYQASISPFSDPPTGVPNPDSDYYVLTANPGTTVTIEIRAQRLTSPSPLDSVLEIVGASNNRLPLCSDPPLYPFGPYNNACLDDDLPDGSSTDSILTLQVPSTNSGPLTFYAHVLDFRGDARPDFIYTITVTGAN